MEEKITLAHGSGGQSSAALMQAIFGKYFHNEYLDRLEDGAVLPGAARIVMSTDSFVVTPLEFPGGSIGKLAVCGTVNDLTMMGAVPRYISTGFVLEEGLSLETLERLVKALAEEAEKAGVVIVTGDTKVVEGRGGLIINTTGIGFLPEGRRLGVDRCEEGDAILLSGTLGDHHACILSARMGIQNDIRSDCACLGPLSDALFAAGIDVKAMRDVTRGGLGTVLNELAEGSGRGIEIEEKALPVSPAVEGFCGLLGLEPLYMGNEGKLVAVVPASRKEEALAALKSSPLGRDARIIGAFTEAHKDVQLVTPLGGRRKVDMLYGEGLPRIC